VGARGTCRVIALPLRRDKITLADARLRRIDDHLSVGPLEFRDVVTFDVLELHGQHAGLCPTPRPSPNVTFPTTVSNVALRV